jgi:hypothetical protein
LPPLEINSRRSPAAFLTCTNFVPEEQPHAPVHQP